MCNERKDITAFNVVRAKTKDGYGEYANSYCKPCTSIRYKMARIRWQQNNPDKIKGYNYTKMNKHKTHTHEKSNDVNDRSSSAIIV